MASGLSTSVRTCMESRADNSNLFPVIDFGPEFSKLECRKASRVQFCKARYEAFKCLGVPERDLTPIFERAISSSYRDAQGRFIEAEYPPVATPFEDAREWGTKADLACLRKMVMDSKFDFNIADQTSTGHLPTRGFIRGPKALEIVLDMITHHYYLLANVGASIEVPIKIQFSVESMERIHERNLTHLPRRMILSEPDAEKRKDTQEKIEEFFDKKIIQGVKEAQESYQSPSGWKQPAELDEGYFEKWRPFIKKLPDVKVRRALSQFIINVPRHNATLILAAYLRHTGDIDAVHHAIKSYREHGTPDNITHRDPAYPWRQLFHEGFCENVEKLRYEEVKEALSLWVVKDLIVHIIYGYYT